MVKILTFTASKQETVEGHRTRNHSYCSILYTPISIPYKADTGALLYWRLKCWGAAGSHKRKTSGIHSLFLEGKYQQFSSFQLGNHTFTTRSLFLPNWRPVLTMFLFKSMVYSGLSSCQTSRPASREQSLK